MSVLTSAFRCPGTSALPGAKGFVGLGARVCVRAVATWCVVLAISGGAGKEGVDGLDRSLGPLREWLQARWRGTAGPQSCGQTGGGAGGGRREQVVGGRGRPGELQAGRRVGICSLQEKDSIMRAVIMITNYT